VYNLVGKIKKKTNQPTIKNNIKCIKQDKPGNRFWVKMLTDVLVL